MTRDEFATVALSCLEEMTGFARRLTRSQADADDLVQTTFERAFRSWRSLRNPDACRAWLFRIARNAFLNERRAAAAGRELHLVDIDDDHMPSAFIPADSVERLDERAFESALAHLPAEQREAVLLCDLWGFRYDEIAQITAAPIGTVRSRIARGRARVVEWLAASRARPTRERGRS